MFTIETFTTFMAWCTLINIGILMFSVLMLVTFKHSIAKIHGKMFNIEPGDLYPIYFKYLGYFKIAVIVFNLGPYLALRIMM